MARRPHPKPTRTYNTRANIKKRMEHLKQENQALREQMTYMQTKMEELTELVKLLAVTQNQPPPPPPLNTRAEATVSTVPEWMICASTPSYSMPQRSMPWFIPFTSGEVLRHTASEAPIPTLQHATHVPSSGATFPPATMT